MSDVNPNSDAAIEWHNKGANFYNSGNYDQAFSAFEYATRLEPQFALAWANKGFALKALGRNTEARAAFAKAKELGYTGPTVFGQITARDWFNKGRALINQSSNNETIKAFDKTIKLKSIGPDPYQSKGVALNNLDKYDEATKAFDDALMVDPEFADIEFGRGNFIIVPGTSDADPESDAAIEWHNKGANFYNSGNYGQAFSAFEYATRLEPQFAPCWASKGFALKALGRNTEAQAAFAKAKKLGYTVPTFVSPDENNRLEAAFVPPHVPQKKVAERFAELNKIKKNVTK